MAEDSPIVVMLAGPNGAGKSSIAPGVLANALKVVDYVNADVIARGISGFNPDGAALSAGRVMLERLDELASERRSFAFETTGASRSFASKIQAWRKSGYLFLLTYVWVESAEVSAQRVKKRVVLGGHDIPDETIRRRYPRSLVNFFELYRPLADEWRIYDNNGPGNAKLVAEGGIERNEIVHGDQAWRTILQMAEESRREVGK